MGHSAFLEMLAARDRLVHLASPQPGATELCPRTAGGNFSSSWSVEQLAPIGKALVEIVSGLAGIDLADEFDSVLGHGISSGAAMAASANV